MAATRINPKRQITIPKPVFEEVRLEVGDVLEASVHDGNILLTPKRSADKAPAAKLTAAEQKIHARAKVKIEQINKDLLNSKGLTLKETEAAAKAGLIAEDQRYFWTEAWQKDMRASERAVRNGDVSPTFDNATDAIAYLHRETAKV